MKRSLVLLFLIAFAVSVHAMDPSVKTRVQDAMKRHVEQVIAAEGFYPVLHEGNVLKLKVRTSDKYPDGFHAGVNNQGSLYASCADFQDAAGNRYDIDFLVSGNDGTFTVVQPIVHSINGEKSPYDLSH